MVPVIYVCHVYERQRDGRIIDVGCGGAGSVATAHSFRECRCCKGSGYGKV